MWLQAKELEVALHAGLGDTRLCGNAAYAPVRRAICRLGVQRRVKQLRDPLIVNSARRAGANAIVETGDAPLDETRAPLAHRGLGQLQSRGDRTIELAIGAAKNNARPAAQCRWQRAVARQRLQLGSLLVAQRQLSFWSACSHQGIFIPKIPHWHAKPMPAICGTGHQMGDRAWAERMIFVLRKGGGMGPRRSRRGG